MSPALNSNVTDKVIKEVKAWQNRQHGRFGLHQVNGGRLIEWHVRQAWWLSQRR